MSRFKVLRDTFAKLPEQDEQFVEMCPWLRLRRGPQGEVGIQLASANEEMVPPGAEAAKSWSEPQWLSGTETHELALTLLAAGVDQ